MSFAARSTPRLLLRPFVASDAADVLAYRGSPEVSRYLMHEPMDEAAVAAFLASVTPARHARVDGHRLQLAVEWQGRVIGDVNLRVSSVQSRQTEIGWVFNPTHHGRGFATEAASELLKVAFEEWGSHRVFAQLDPKNAASARLCERLGLRREAHLREESWFKGEWGDLLIYAVLAQEWATPAES
ncbi:MAG: GNAT family N-acetyltransferase [Actinobacteria bacterium]|nr:GNAT family N-acetyltransferase [Actinomycetota bacterium]